MWYTDTCLSSGLHRVLFLARWEHRYLQIGISCLETMAIRHRAANGCRSCEWTKFFFLNFLNGYTRYNSLIHFINHLTKDVLSYQPVTNIKYRVTGLIKYFKSSWRASAIGSSLSSYYVTRWNSFLLGLMQRLGVLSIQKTCTRGGKMENMYFPFDKKKNYDKLTYSWFYDNEFKKMTIFTFYFPE